MKQRSALAQIVDSAKADEWSKARGGFAVYRMSSGNLDYFHNGQVPNVAGEPDRNAALVGRWRWNFARWSRIA